MPCHEKSSLRKAVLYQQLLLINKLVTKIMEDSDSEISSYGLSLDTEHISVPSDDSISIKEQLKMCCKPTYRIRRVKSRGAILILVWNFLVISILWYLGKNQYNRGFIRNNNGSIFVGLAFLAVTVPLAGWLADTCIGRYRMIYCSILIMWGAAILETVSSVADSLSAGYYFAKSVIKQVLLALMGIGMGGFLSTVAIYLTSLWLLGNDDETYGVIYEVIYEVIQDNSRNPSGAIIWAVKVASPRLPNLFSVARETLKRSGRLGTRLGLVAASL